MTWAKTDISAAEVANRAADYPTLFVGNSLSTANRVWWRKTTGTFVTADEADASYPTTRLYDGHADLFSTIFAFVVYQEGHIAE